MTTRTSLRRTSLISLSGFALLTSVAAAAAPSSAASALVVYDTPTTAYLLNTCLIDVSGVEGESVTTLTGCGQTITVAPTVVRAEVGSTWTDWGIDGEDWVEDPAPPLLWLKTATALTLSFSFPVDLAGVEAEPNASDSHAFTATYKNGAGATVTTVARDIDGNAGARLLAADAVGTKSLTISTDVDFAIAQIRVGSATNPTWLHHRVPQVHPAPYPNVDRFQFDVWAPHWAAVGLRAPAGNAVNLTLFRDRPNTVPLARSALPQGAIEFVVVDGHHTLLWPEHYPTVHSKSQYTIQIDSDNELMQCPGSKTFNMGPAKVIRAIDFLFQPSTTFTMTATPPGGANGDIFLMQSDASDPWSIYQSRSQAVAQSITGGPGAVEDWYGLILTNRSGGGPYTITCTQP